MRIHILGGPGSGKSHLARRLSRALGIPRYELDDLFWENAGRNGVRTEPDLRDRALAAIAAKPEWIVEGVYHAWVGESFTRADVIAILQPSLALRHWRVLRRSGRRLLGGDGARGESLASLWALLRYSHRWDEDELLAALETLAPHANKLCFAADADEAEHMIREST